MKARDSFYHEFREVPGCPNLIMVGRQTYEIAEVNGYAELVLYALPDEPKPEDVLKYLPSDQMMEVYLRKLINDRKRSAWARKTYEDLHFNPF